MTQLIRYLKPFGWQILIVFVLLFAQAMTDLALPNYMSKIVNIGIQQSGIENAVPEAVRASEMGKFTIFISEEDQDVIAEDFILLDRETLSQKDYVRYFQEYPVLIDEPVYKLNTDDPEELEKLDAIFGGAIMLVSAIDQKGLEAFAGMEAAVPEIPEGVDPFALLAQLPEEQLEMVRQMAARMLADIPESIINQSAVSYLAEEYKTVGIDIGAHQNSYILEIGGIMLLLALAGAICSIIVGFISARIAAAFSRDTRRRLFDKVEHFSNSEFDRFSAASLITRSTNDIQQILLVMVMMLRSLFYAPIVGIGGVFMALREDTSLSWVIAVAVGAVIILVGVTFSISLPRFKLMQKLVDKLNLSTREILSGLMVIRAFNTQGYEEKKFDNVNVDLTKTQLFVHRVMVFHMPVMMLIMNGVQLMVLWFGAGRVDMGAMQVGNLMAFMQYTMQIIMSFMMVSMMFVMLPRAAVSAQRISEVLETEPVIKDPPRPQRFGGDLRGLVEFKDVSFKYAEAEEYVLKDISFVARPGQTTAFIGGTGSGKSTLVNLIPRFYDVTSGKVLVDGLDVREVTQHDLRDRVGYIPQTATLFSGTVESNIRYGKEEADEHEVTKAAEIAQALDFIKAGEAGFEMHVAQGGANLSGGQKQRLSIARALAKRPEIYIFDDSFSAIDFKTDAALRRALRKETGDATVLIVAQRISTIMNAEQIIVLENGRIVGVGRHKALMESCEVYRELALSQLSKEELS